MCFIMATLFCTIKLLNENICFGSLAEMVSALIAISAFGIACKEYFGHKDARQAQILSEYNKRYSNDNNVVKVVKWLNYIEDVNRNPYAHYIDKPEKPTNYEVEMFMRFFEELELQIEKGRLERKDVNNLFVYYAKKIHDGQELRRFLGIEDKEYKYNKDDENFCWELFRKLVEH